MKLVVFGASGQVGRHVMRMAPGRGHEVTGIVRQPMPDMPSGVRFEVGDPLDAAFVARAMLGAEAVISCLGPKRVAPSNPWSRLAGPPDFAERTGRNIVDAARTAQIRRVVAVSAAGVGDSYPGLNLAMRFLLFSSTIGVMYRDLERMETEYACSGLDWTTVRPVTLTNGEPGPVREVDRFGATMSIPRASVAAWLLDAVVGPGAEPRTPQIAA